MNLAAEAAASTRFFFLDIILIIFTLLIAAGIYRLLKEPKRNLFAIGFGTVCLLTFLLIDLLMLLNWLGYLEDVQAEVQKFM